MIIDVCCFNAEYDLFELRYQILKKYVDVFVVVEFDRTFSGADKPSYTLKSKEYFYDAIDTWPKVQYFNFNHHHYEQYRALALSSPNTEYGKGAEHWITEFMQKESLKDALAALNPKDEDIIYLNDTDEIWNPRLQWPDFTGTPLKLKLDVYTYFLNNHSSEEFYGTLVSEYRFIKNECLNHLRTNAQKTNFLAGWHFTSMGGYEGLFKKLSDSYTDESYFTPDVVATLRKNIETSKDFLGRDFTYTLDENTWPDYLKANREKYAHLLKTVDNQ